MRGLFIIVVLLTILTGCWKYNISNLGNYTAEHETWRKKGVSPFLGVRKALLECGKVSLGGVAEEEYRKVGILERKDQYNHEFLVDRCMLKAGFVEQNTSWALKDACTDMRYLEYPACQPDAVIPTPTVERRLNSRYCKVRSDYDYCLKHALAPQLCNPEKIKTPPPECLADEN
nr:hypothetical protein [uncultured Methylotenera sp.]